ncbi:MAG: hypothetical protein ACK56Q_16590, partial [Pirellulaceae bacterium]
MPDYAYVAKTATGMETRGVVPAVNRREAMQRLRQKSLFPVSLTETKSASDTSSSLAHWMPVKKEQVADFCTQLADLL